MDFISAVREYLSWAQYLKQLGPRYNVYNTIWNRSWFRKLQPTLYISRLADGLLSIPREWAASLHATDKRTWYWPPPTSSPTRCFSTLPILSSSYKSWQSTAKMIWLTSDQRGPFLTVNILFYVHSWIGLTSTLTSTAQHWICSIPWTWRHQRKHRSSGSWCIMPWTTSSR